LVEGLIKRDRIPAEGRREGMRGESRKKYLDFFGRD
jgi:hypothetical protein